MDNELELENDFDKSEIDLDKLESYITLLKLQLEVQDLKDTVYARILEPLDECSKLMVENASSPW